MQQRTSATPNADVMRKCVKNVICIVPTIVEGEPGRNCRREHKKQ